MYGFIWRHLPGPAWLKAIEALILTAGIVYVLMQYVFPWANATLFRSPVSRGGSFCLGPPSTAYRLGDPVNRRIGQGGHVMIDVEERRQ